MNITKHDHAPAAETVRCGNGAPQAHSCDGDGHGDGGVGDGCDDDDRIDIFHGCLTYEEQAGTCGYEYSKNSAWMHLLVYVSRCIYIPFCVVLRHVLVFSNHVSVVVGLTLGGSKLQRWMYMHARCTCDDSEQVVDICIPNRSRQRRRIEESHNERFVSVVCCSRVVSVVFVLCCCVFACLACLDAPAKQIMKRVIRPQSGSHEYNSLHHVLNHHDSSGSCTPCDVRRNLSLLSPVNKFQDEDIINHTQQCCVEDRDGLFVWTYDGCDVTWNFRLPGRVRRLDVWECNLRHAESPVRGRLLRFVFVPIILSPVPVHVVDTKFALSVSTHGPLVMSAGMNSIRLRGVNQWHGLPAGHENALHGTDSPVRFALSSDVFCVNGENNFLLQTLDNIGRLLTLGWCLPLAMHLIISAPVLGDSGEMNAQMLMWDTCIILLAWCSNLHSTLRLQAASIKLDHHCPTSCAGSSGDCANG